MTFFFDPVTFIVQWVHGLLVGWGMPAETATTVLNALGAAILPLSAMLFTIFLIWLERKLLGRIQDRIGPNRLGPFGLFQPFADMAKIFIKEYINPIGFSWLPYNLAPVMAVASVLMLWTVIPLTVSVFGTDLNVGLLFLIGVGTFGFVAELMAGWASNNKYTLFGAFRSIAVLVAYEVPMVIILLLPVMLTGSLSMVDIVNAQDIWFIFLMPLAALIFLVTSIAESARSPFDLLEAESELVSGFNTEYSGLKFGMFYVADFLRAFTLSLVFATIFLGGWRGPFAEQYPILGMVYLIIKTSIFYFLGILIRGSMPRIRIDQMLDINWKYLTPLSLVLVIVSALIFKAIPAEMLWLRLIVSVAVNLGLYFVADKMLATGMKRAKRDVVKTNVPSQRIVIPEPAAVNDTGAQP